MDTGATYSRQAPANGQRPKGIRERGRRMPDWNRRLFVYRQPLGYVEGGIIPNPDSNTRGYPGRLETGEQTGSRKERR